MNPNQPPAMQQMAPTFLSVDESPDGNLMNVQIVMIGCLSLVTQLNKKGCKKLGQALLDWSKDRPWEEIQKDLARQEPEIIQAPPGMRLNLNGFNP